MTDAAENERQYRIVDQMLSMHSSLRDKYARKALFLNVGLVAASVVLCAFVFIDEAVFTTLGIDTAAAKIGLGFTSILVLILSILEFRVDWKGASGRHDEAVQELASLKLAFRKTHTETSGSDPKKNARLSREFESVHKRITPIPERLFSKLKAEHSFKILLSQRITENPKAPVWVLRFLLRCEGIWTALSKQKSHRDSSDGDATQ